MHIKHTDSVRRNKGFTLLELLIVVAIIALLASVILFAVSTARQNSKNTARNKAVEEYTKALELTRTEANSYPDSGGAFVCLGDYPDNGCWTNGTANAESATINAALATYIKNPPGATVNVYEGYIYQSVGTSYEIRYMLDGTNQRCLKGQTPISTNYNSLGITYCRYQHQ